MSRLLVPIPGSALVPSAGDAVPPSRTLRLRGAHAPSRVGEGARLRPNSARKAPKPCSEFYPENKTAARQSEPALTPRDLIDMPMAAAISFSLLISTVTFSDFSFDP